MYAPTESSSGYADYQQDVLSVESLTARELEVLDLVADGYSNLEIAKRLNIRKPTIGSHLRNIYQKMQCSTRTQAAVRAMRLGLIS